MQDAIFAQTPEMLPRAKDCADKLTGWYEKVGRHEDSARQLRQAADQLDSGSAQRIALLCRLADVQVCFVEICLDRIAENRTFRCVAYYSRHVTTTALRLWPWLSISSSKGVMQTHARRRKCCLGQHMRGQTRCERLWM